MCFGISGLLAPLCPIPWCCGILICVGHQRDFPNTREKDPMPKTSQHTFAWSDKLQQYALHTPGHPRHQFHAGDAPAFARWVESHTSFAFVGQRGRLSVRKEARPRGTGYWYASHKQGRRTRKRYLGRADQVTFARLEEVAHVLTSQPESAPFVSGPGTPASELNGILLASKLSVPRLPNALVERPRLLADLEAVSAHPFTLISACAGSGRLFASDLDLNPHECSPLPDSYRSAG
jgi:LuxR family transcriptional regulator, maltose regulon positive regulatory protein